MKFKHILSIIILLNFTAYTLAQNTKEVLCKVLDAETKYPVSYATVKFEDIQNGVIADEEGDFRLPLNDTTVDKNIIISSIGFETLTLSVSSLNRNTINSIYLKPKVESLGVVLITGSTNSNNQTSSAKDIIEEAIKKIPVNYPRSPHSYIGYYRDYQLVKNKYYNLNESILETFDAGFQTSKYKYSHNLTALYSYTTNKDFYLDSLLLKSIYNDSKIVNKDESAKFVTALQNELEILNVHNPIRNYNKNSFSFINTFRSDFVENHLFKLEGLSYNNTIPLYRISFVSQGADNSKFRAIGEIYIAKTNYAIYKIEYKMIENDKFKSYQINKGSLGSGKRLQTVYEVTVEYKEINDKMYLNYMTFNNKFIVKEPNPFDVVDFEFDPKDKAFYITFNKPVDKSSIERKSRFRLLYKDKKLIIKQIELVENTIVKVQVVDWAAGTKAKLNKVKSEDFSYKLKRIKDVSGVTIYKESKLLGYQFREFFTQEVFENKTPSEDLIYMLKLNPLSDAKVNEAKFDINTYWINSPLKQTKGDN